jgi:peptide/nickel transport system substrate-binding protein
MILTLGFSALSNYLPYVDSITAPDDTTLVWKTTKPTMSPLIPPWISILPEHTWSQLLPISLEDLSGLDAEARKAAIAEDKTAIRTFPDFPDAVTSGPFRMVEWNKNEDWTLEANKDYWGGSPTIDEVIVKVYKNAETMVQDLKQGAIDFAEAIPANLFGSLENQPGITRNVGSAFAFDQMSFNMCDASDPDAAPYCKSHPGTGNPALRDVNVRRAVDTARPVPPSCRPGPPSGTGIQVRTRSPSTSPGRTRSSTKPATRTPTTTASGTTRRPVTT